MVHDAPLYSVWDNEKKGLAIFEDRECADINFDDAFKMADYLNAQNAHPKEK
jgi:hypothetical protein